MLGLETSRLWASCVLFVVYKDLLSSWFWFYLPSHNLVYDENTEFQRKNRTRKRTVFKLLYIFCFHVVPCGKENWNLASCLKLGEEKLQVKKLTNQSKKNNYFLKNIWETLDGSSGKGKQGKHHHLWTLKHLQSENKPATIAVGCKGLTNLREEAVFNLGKGVKGTLKVGVWKIRHIYFGHWLKNSAKVW